LTLAGLVLVAIAARPAAASGTGDIVARLGSITVTATSLHTGPSDTLASNVYITTSGAASDVLDAALASDQAPVGVYHERVSVGEIPDLASCDGDIPPPSVVEQWLHYGPLLVPGRSSGQAAPARATLRVATFGDPAIDGNLAVSLYFVHAGQLTLRLPVDRY
jgi:hypothetical protein